MLLLKDKHLNACAYKHTHASRRLLYILSFSILLFSHNISDVHRTCLFFLLLFLLIYQLEMTRNQNTQIYEFDVLPYGLSCVFKTKLG